MAGASAEQTVYTVPGYVVDFIRRAGYPVPYTSMAGCIEQWWQWYRASGGFYDYDGRDGAGRVYRVHRRSVHPAKMVCDEWGSLLLNDRTTVDCGEQACTDWLAGYFDRVNFQGLGQQMLSRAFGLGTGAWAVWLDPARRRMQLRRYDARMVLPLSWDDDGVTECAFATRVTSRGRQYDQLQMHVEGPDGYHVVTAAFDDQGRPVELEGVEPDFPTRCPTPTFAVVRPAVDNTRVDLSPYGQSVYADAVDAVQAVDLAYDAVYNEVDLGKMRVFLSDMLFEVSDDGKGERQAVPFGREDMVVFRKVATSEGDTIKEFAPQLRTDAQVAAYRLALQTLGQMTGFGLTYFDVDKSGGVRTATEVSSDNSQLMRSVRRHENLLEGAICQISHAALHCAREFLGESLPEEGELSVAFDDSIITDTAAEKAQDMAEVNVTMQPWEYRAKWYGEDEETARRNAPGGPAPAPDFASFEG